MSRDSETFRLLQPGLMSTEELKEIITQRGIHLKHGASKTKDQLVEIYEQLLLPLSQRQFPNTYKGKELNKKIAEEDHKKSRNEPKLIEFQYGFKDKTCGGSSTSGIKRPAGSQNTNNSNRLKPPLESSNVPAKKICLSKPSSSDKSLDKIVINDRSRKNSDSNNEKNDKKSTTAVNGEKSEKKSEKRSTEKIHTSSNKESKNEDGEPKEKRKRIAWP